MLARLTMSCHRLRTPTGPFGELYSKIRLHNATRACNLRFIKAASQEQAAIELRSHCACACFNSRRGRIRF